MPKGLKNIHTTIIIMSLLNIDCLFRIIVCKILYFINRLMWFILKEKHKIEEENMKLKLKLERAIEHRPILLQTATSINNIMTVVNTILVIAN